MSALVFSGVRKTFGSTVALADLDLEVQPGELISLLGPSGCGKTTALRIAAGFERPDIGVVRIAGADVTALSPDRRDTGMVFQNYSLFPHLTVSENIGFGMKMRRKGDAATRKRRASELLEMVGLADHGGRYAHQLSGGQQQRVALIRALAIEPRVLLLDEPLSALDAKVRVQLREEIRRIQQDLGITTLFVTHDQEEALAISDRVGVMSRGVLEQLDAPRTVYDRPANSFVARFVGRTNALTVHADGGVARLGGRTIGVLPPGLRRHDGELTLLVRPEHVTVAATDVDSSGANDGVAGRIVSQSFAGPRTILTIRLGDGPQEVEADIASATTDPTHTAIGRTVVARVDFANAVTD